MKSEEETPRARSKSPIRCDEPIYDGPYHEATLIPINIVTQLKSQKIKPVDYFSELSPERTSVIKKCKDIFVLKKGNRKQSQL